MPRTVDQIRASKLPSNMMQFAARGALQVPPAENIEILVYLALHNKVFGDTARMTLAGWDEKACLAAASDPQTPKEILDYFVAPDNLRPTLLPALLENPSVPEAGLAKLALSAMRDTAEVILKSARAISLPAVVEALKANPYIKKEETAILGKAAPSQIPAPAPEPVSAEAPHALSGSERSHGESASSESADAVASEPATSPEGDEVVSVYLKDNASEIAAEGEKPFQAIGGVFDLLGPDYFPVTHNEEMPQPAPANTAAAATPTKAAVPAQALRKKPPQGEPKRENTLQKINALDIKGRIQLALKGNKEERSLLIRDGTKVVALAVLEAPKLSDGEVEKFASQKNVLEAVLRQIPLKRRFMKNYIVVRNLVANPRTPLDLGLGLMKNLLLQDLKNISANKEISETIRKLALKMYKQKLEAANKK
jgi:hypothetical protein